MKIEQEELVKEFEKNLKDLDEKLSSLKVKLKKRSGEVSDTELKEIEQMFKERISDVHRLGSDVPGKSTVILWLKLGRYWMQNKTK